MSSKFKPFSLKYDLSTVVFCAETFAEPDKFLLEERGDGMGKGARNSSSLVMVSEVFLTLVGREVDGSGFGRMSFKAGDFLVGVLVVPSFTGVALPFFFGGELALDVSVPVGDVSNFLGPPNRFLFLFPEPKT